MMGVDNRAHFSVLFCARFFFFFWRTPMETIDAIVLGVLLVACIIGLWAVTGNDNPYRMPGGRK